MSLIGIGAGIPFVRGGGLVRAIQALFAASEKGVWYDPSDLTSMFQDSAGTTAAVVGQPVGLVLDKSKGLVRGPELVANGGFDSADGWVVPAGWSISSGVAQGIAGVSGQIYRAAGIVLGKTYEVIFTVIAGTAGSVTAQVGVWSMGPSVSAAGVHRQIISAVHANTSANMAFAKSADFDGAIDNISVRELPGYHATQATTAAKPILQQDAGGHYYLQFDGFDDFMATPSIDFSGTDKMTVVAGVRKLSDAAQGAIVELTASTAANNGGFLLAAPDGATATYAFDSKGTVQTDAVGSGFTAPLTSVLTGLGNISGDSAIIRVNGTQADQDTADQGTGNYANAAMYIGMRGGLSIPFNGHLYSLVVRGALSDAAQISAAEAFCNSKTGAWA